MIIKDKDAIARLESPMNLINRLSSLSSPKVNGKTQAMSLFGMGRKEKEVQSAHNSSSVESAITGEPHPAENTRIFNPFQNPSLNIPLESVLDNILENNESQIKLGLAHDSALKLLNNSIDALAAKLDDVRADRLPSVIAAASKTVESIRKERIEQSKGGKDKEVHYHFYTPEQRKLESYEVIDVA